MCNFATMTDDEKERHHTALLHFAESFGGKNFFLQLLEAIRAEKPHPLMAASKRFDMDLGTITWDKVIFKDKLDLLFRARRNESERDNLLPAPDEKEYKKILNLVRTLKPITFQITPADAADGSGFSLAPFEIVDEKTTRLNVLFDMLFFCSVDAVKKALNYTPKGQG